MSKLHLLLVVISIVLAACQASTITPVVPAADAVTAAVIPTATRLPAPTNTAPPATIPTSVTPVASKVAGPAPSACGPLSISLPEAARFAPVEDATGAIAYSDDGLWLTFPETGATVAVHPLGGDTRKADRSFAWSPDGRQIGFVHALYGPPLECQLGYLLLADLDFGEVRVLLPRPGVYSQPAWSPGGERLAFVRVTQPGLGELSVLHVPSGTQITLGERASSWQWLAPAWLDDEHVLYARVNGADPQRFDLVSQPLGEGEPRIVVPAEETFGLKTFAFSPHARQVAFNRGSQVVLVDVDSGAATSVGVMPEVLMLFWAPDGRHILGQAGLGDLYLAQVGSPSSAVHLGFSGVLGQIQPWAPDSRRFALVVGSAPHLGIYDVGERALASLPIVVGRPWELAWGPR